ncbi:transmembrane protein, putative [Bodo saltans]|uniref:Transmembrane protein, putative n=1 Tax=Bodo saltans TaxID=75058 RepID=A0A0S4JH60_BODSA|nr:transmembrane protein, putative [Bodo saltans]|eukprot:CUG89689.1 transmembrane protein, putative [Bodo saltans]
MLATTSETYLYARSPLRRTMLGWPALIIVWCYVIWLMSRFLGSLSSQPVQHSGASSIDPKWMTTLLPAMYVPTIVLFAYCNWLGWKFFQHN